MMNTRAGAISSSPLITKRARASFFDRGLGGKILFVLAMVGIVTNGVLLPAVGTPQALERFVGLGLIVAMFLSFFSANRNYPGSKLLYIWLSWNGVLLISTLLTPQPALHLPGLITSLIPAAGFWLIAYFQFSGKLISRVTAILLWINGIAATVLVALRVSKKIEVPVLYDYLGRLKILFLEPNIMGSSIGFLIFVSLAHLKISKSSLAMIAFALIALLASGSRMPYVAFGICSVLYGVLRAMALRRGLAMSVVLPIWLVGALLVAGLAFSHNVASFYDKTISHEDTYSARAFVNKLAFDRFTEQPIVGRGPGDFKLLDPELLRGFGVHTAAGLWIPNIIVAVLHDSGILGILTYGIFLAGLLWRGLKLILEGSIEHCGYLAGFVFLFLCSQATTVHLILIFGISAGLIALRPARSRRPGTALVRMPARRVMVPFAKL